MNSALNLISTFSKSDNADNILPSIVNTLHNSLTYSKNLKAPKCAFPIPDQQGLKRIWRHNFFCLPFIIEKAGKIPEFVTILGYMCMVIHSGPQNFKARPHNFSVQAKGQESQTKNILNDLLKICELSI